MRTIAAIPWRIVILISGLLLFLFTLYQTAWVGDDAYISFRVVDNFVHGYGLRWNIAERVWVYTNPLWVLLMSAVNLLTHEFYYTSLALSAVVSSLTLWLLGTRLTKSLPQLLCVLVIVIGSKAFTDYSTSGLENPLTHLLLVCFWIALLTQERGEKRFLWLSLWTALILVNRMDTVMLVLPALLLAAFDQPVLRTIRIGLLGMLPFIVWELFAIWYYGMPFPNTFYAKTQTGIASGPLMAQGVQYFLDSFQRDPITLSVIGGSLVLAFTERKRERLVIGLGILLSLLYTVRVGADFMSGRFFTAPLVCSLVIIATDSRLVVKYFGYSLAAAVLILAALNPIPPFFSGADYGTSKEKNGIPLSGVADERGWYYAATGLRTQTTNVIPNHRWLLEGFKERTKGKHLNHTGCVGFFGLGAGPLVHIVDEFALVDPLLARIQTEWKRGWRIGHFSRVAPVGYQKTLESNLNFIQDSNLARYYSQVMILSRDPLSSVSRLRSIWLFNTGAYDTLIDAYNSTTPVVRDYAEVSSPPRDLMPGEIPPSIVTRKGGLRVNLKGPRTEAHLEISFDSNDELFAIWFLGERELGWVHVTLDSTSQQGMRIDTIDTPNTALGGYDRLEIIPCFGDDNYSVDHVRLID